MPNKFLTIIAAMTLTASMGLAKKSSANRLASDNTFITKAAQGGMAEVEMGRLASKQASSDKVKQFGQRMVDDHSKANDELRKVASQKGATIPSTLDSKDQAELDRLSKMNGAQFDQAYMQAMVRDHHADVTEFKREANSGQDPDVKAFASKTLPTLEDHLKLAQQTEKDVKK